MSHVGSKLVLPEPTSTLLPILASALAAQTHQKRIATVPHLDLDFDIEERPASLSLRASDTVPARPQLATSLDKYQILWRVDGFTFEQQKKQALKLLAIPPSAAIPPAPTATGSSTWPGFTELRVRSGISR